MIISSFQCNLEEVIESSLKFKFHVLAIGKLTSTVKRNARYSTSSIFPTTPKTKGRRTVLTQNTLSLKLSTWLIAKVDLILSKPSKSDKLDNIEVLLNNLTTAISSNKESVSKLERDMSFSGSKFKNTHHLLNELKEGLIVCEEVIYLVSKKSFES